MGNFLKYVAATVVGILVCSIICLFFTVISVIGMASSGTVSVPKNAVMVLKLNGSISERAEESPLSALLGAVNQDQMGLDNLLRAVRNAKENDRVKAIYIETSSFAGASVAQLQELRQALVSFKESGKPILAYGDVFTQGAYYVCSVADSLLVNPEGMIDWKGMAVQTVYYKDLLDKLGVQMQVVKVGTYKSAVEPYLMNEMSDANREQIETFSGEIWNQLVTEVGQSRDIDAQTLNALADTSMLFQPAQAYVKAKLADRLAYSDEVPGVLARMIDVKSPKNYETITASDLAQVAAKQPKGTSGKTVAVYYANGNIVEQAASGLSGGAEIVGSTTVDDLLKLADDDDVQAVVLRVNSPGGSAYASEQIWHAVEMVKAKKPVVVSMGAYAASGGYYISSGANLIVAEPTTLTGSIGIFGMFPNAGELITEKVGVHPQTVKTNQMADFGDITRPMTEGERQQMQAYVDRGYELFTKRCAQGRNLPQDSIKQIGEGRVWTGEHALKIGLVDQLGNLDDAIAAAKKLAGLENATVLCYPAKKDILSQLLDEASSTGSYADRKLRDALGEHYDLVNTLTHLNRRPSVQAIMPCQYIFF